MSQHLGEYSVVAFALPRMHGLGDLGGGTTSTRSAAHGLFSSKSLLPHIQGSTHTQPRCPARASCTTIITPLSSEQQRLTAAASYAVQPAGVGVATVPCSDVRGSVGAGLKWCQLCAVLHQLGGRVRSPHSFSPRCAHACCRRYSAALGSVWRRSQWTARRITPSAGAAGRQSARRMYSRAGGVRPLPFPPLSHGLPCLPIQASRPS